MMFFLFFIVPKILYALPNFRGHHLDFLPFNFQIMGRSLIIKHVTRRPLDFSDLSTSHPRGFQRAWGF